MQAAALVLLPLLENAIEVLGGHLRCSVCLGRPARIGTTKERPDRSEWIALDGDWKRLVKRLQD